jgi:uncharacterized protein (DUF362 family)
MTVKVGIVKTEKAEYPQNAPFNPSENFPEYQFGDNISSEINYVYPALRQLFVELGYDIENYGKPEWNPLGFLIRPEMTVVLKPNFVRSRHYDGKDPFAMITHPSVLRAVADYCRIALKGKGKIIIADAPNFDSDFAELLELTKLGEVADFYNSFQEIEFAVYDLRDYWGKSRVPFLETRHMASCERKLPGDPQGSMIVNLRKNSALYNHPNPDKFYGAVFDRQETIRHHTGERQEYEVAQTVMNADVVISIPKMKVHKRSGVTLNVKGLVGICTNKNFLVHYILGEPREGGDQFPNDFLTNKESKIVRFERWMYDTFLSRRSVAFEMVHRFVFGVFYLKIGKKLGLKIPKQKRMFEPGNWFGNDSTWRMATDLLKVILFADKEGELKSCFQRKFFSIVDGIIGGENKGPMLPDPKSAGVLVGGENYLAVDIVAARLMGFDPLKIKLYEYLLADAVFNYGISDYKDIEVISKNLEWNNCLSDENAKFLSFKPYPSWIGHIEI